MYGYRGRIGLIVPSSNTVCEPEMNILSPPGVSTYSTRILFEPTLEGLTGMKTHIQRASMELSSENICQVLAFCCTVGSLMKGVDTEREITKIIEDASKVHAITTATAVKSALDVMQIKHIAIATPYTQAINMCEKDELERQGYHVTKIMGYHESVPSKDFKNDMIGRLDPEVAYEMGLKVNGSDNEAIFLSCTNFRTIEIIRKLEQECKKPVISSNQATMWYALRKLGIKESVKNFGELLKRY